MIRFSLIHPSRNRLRMAEGAIREWTGNFSATNEYEYILSIDEDDDDIPGYRQMAERLGVRLLVHRNRSIVDAVNRAAEQASGEVYIVVSDDFGCPEQWDVTLASVIGDRRDAAVLVNDGGGGQLLTLPIVGCDLYRRLGYLYYPDYFSMYCDNDLTQTALALGKLIDARELLFPHRHCSVDGGHPNDATYERENSNAAWWIGWRVFEKRRAAGFGLRPPSVALFLEQRWIDVRYYVRKAGSAVKNLLRRCGVTFR